MLKTLDEEINPHHSGFAVAARDDNDVQTVGFHAHAYDQTIQTVFLKRKYLHNYSDIFLTISISLSLNIHYKIQYT